jgi:hypothetical protein
MRPHYGAFLDHRRSAQARYCTCDTTIPEQYLFRGRGQHVALLKAGNKEHIFRPVAPSFGQRLLVLCRKLYGAAHLRTVLLHRDVRGILFDIRIVVFEPRGVCGFLPGKPCDRLIGRRYTDRHEHIDLCHHISYMVFLRMSFRPLPLPPFCLLDKSLQTSALIFLVLLFRATVKLELHVVRTRDM